jgi:2-oxoglutarate ferredoxin oxidoreductase subunit gamma
MTEKIICAGFGGQGIMILGKLIAYSAMRRKYNVTWMPSYGAEVRGGTAHCMVVVSDKEIGSPILSFCDVAVVMNKPSLDKFFRAVKPGGLLILNSSLANTSSKKKGIDILKIPMTEMAHDIGNVRVANMIAFGAYIAKRQLFSKEIAVKGINIAFCGKKDLIDLNIKALEKGLNIK